MKILLETTDPQTYSFIPREYVVLLNYTITNESTNTSVTYLDITAETNGGYLEITEVFDLEENTFYNIEVTNTNDTVIFRDRIFCTNQDIDKFTMNKDKYIEDDSKDNEYKFYNG